MQTVFWLAIVTWAFNLGIGCGDPPPIVVLTGPRIHGIAPNESRDNETVYIEGKGFTAASAQPLMVKLVAAGGTEYAVEIQNVMANRLKVKLPNLSSLTARTLFTLVVNDNNIVHESANRIYVRPNNNAQLDGERIQMQFIRWRPAFTCDSDLPPAGDIPWECDCFETQYVSDFQIATQGVDPDPSDTWGVSYWSDFNEQWKDASREWSAMCSPAWGSLDFIKEIEEVENRITLYSADYYWLNLDPISPNTWHLARARGTLHPSGQLPPPYCTPNDSAAVMPNDCALWKPNLAAPTRVNVHWVGAFYDGIDEIDPMVLGGVTNPGSTHGSTFGMIVLTDNPALASRKRPVNVGCANQHLYAATSAINRNYWEAERPTDATPNLLSHELHHLLTGWAHTEALPDPCFTPSVANEAASPGCHRGFNLKVLPGLEGTSVKYECQRIKLGGPQGDFTR